MTALMVIERDTLIATLAENETLSTMVEGRFLWLFASREGEAQYPYVMIKHIHGGYNNMAQAEDSSSVWEVCGRTDNIHDTTDLLNEIETSLHRVIPETPYPNEAEPQRYIEQIAPIARTIETQNAVVYDVGGEYRITLNLQYEGDE